MDQQSIVTYLSLKGLNFDTSKAGSQVHHLRSPVDPYRQLMQFFSPLKSHIGMRISGVDGQTGAMLCGSGLIEGMPKVLRMIQVLLDQFRDANQSPPTPDICEFFLNILSQIRSMDICCFGAEIIGRLEYVCHPEERNMHHRKVIHHCANALIDNTRMIMGQSEQSRFKGPEHASCCPHFVHVASFSLVHEKKLKGRSLVEGKDFYQCFLNS
jgi:hypothetical protein